MHLRTSFFAVASAAVLLSACAESETLKHMDAEGSGGAAGSSAAGGNGSTDSAAGGPTGGSAGQPGSGGADPGSGGSAGAGEGAAAGSGGAGTGGVGNAGAGGSPSNGSGGAGAAGGTGATGAGATGAGGSGATGAGGSGATGSGGGAGVADSCPGQALSFTGSGSIRTASVSGTTVGAIADLTGGCGSSGTSPDLVYEIIPDTDGRLVFTLDPDSGFDAVLYVHESGCNLYEAACVDDGVGGGTEEIELWVTAGTKYYAIVDGYSGASGGFNLDATLYPATPGDTCPGEPATWSGTGPYTWSASGDTSNRPNNYGSSGCGSAAGDAVYALTAPVNGTLTVEVSGSFDSEIFLSTSCGDYDLACNDDTGSSGTETFSVPVASGTTYYVVIDGYSSSYSGSYNVNATITEPAANDVCPGEDLTFNGNTASVSGSTVNSTNDYAGTCGTGGGYSPELVYHFVAPTTGSYTATLTGSSSYDSVLYVRSGTCGSGAELDCADDRASGGTETVTFNATANTDYWVFVDGYGGKSGTFTLNITHN
ncbi:MAG: hypothetical protein R3B07_19245 [Polyangiaceae bacterium]